MTYPFREEDSSALRNILGFWLGMLIVLTAAALFVLGLVAVQLLSEPSVCVSSQMVEIGQDPIVNPVTCE